MNPSVATALSNLTEEKEALQKEVRELKQKLQHSRTAVFDLRLSQRNLLAHIQTPWYKRLKPLARLRASR